MAATRLFARNTEVGTGRVRRVLPNRARRNIGAWVFLDHFGPTQLPAKDGGVGPHPHVGIQTATWLFEGEMHHGDSLGNQQVIEPGQLNLMTAGTGVAHWELTKADGPRTSHGVQLWIALPEFERQGKPGFAHHGELPDIELGGWTGKVFIGEFAGKASPAKVYSPLVGVELVGDEPVTLDLDPDWEYGILVDTGTIQIGTEKYFTGHTAFIPTGTGKVELTPQNKCRLMLIGGAPFDERPLLWWNFVARTHEEIVEALTNWKERKGYGDDSTWPGTALEAPELRGKLIPR